MLKSGEIVSDGAGGLTGSLDVDPLLGGTVDVMPRSSAFDHTENAGPVARNLSVSETYAPAATGRFVVSYDSLPWQAVYLVSPNKGYVIDISGTSWQPLEELNHQ